MHSRVTFLLDSSMCLGYLDVFCKAQYGGLPRCCAVEQLGLLILFHYLS